MLAETVDRELYCSIDCSDLRLIFLCSGADQFLRQWHSQKNDLFTRIIRSLFNVLTGL